MYEPQITSGRIDVTADLSSTPSNVPLHLRGGAVFPLQYPANNTVYSRRNNLHMLVALDGAGRAAGSLYMDDGESIDDAMENYSRLEMTVEEGRMNAVASRQAYTDLGGVVVDKVTVLGVENFGGEVRSAEGRLHRDVDYDPVKKVLVISNLSLSPVEDFSLSWA